MEDKKKCGKCRWNCIEAPYSRLMYKLGQSVAKRPIPFVIIPLIIGIGLGTGMMKLHTENDGAYLYAPKGNRAEQDSNTINQMFPVNYSDGFLPYAAARKINFVTILIEALDGNILTPAHFTDALAIEKYASQEHKSSEGYTFQDLCGKWGNKCLPTSPLLDLVREQTEVINTISLTDPVTTLPNGYDLFVGQTLGDKELSTSGIILKARYLLLSLFLREDRNGDVISWVRSLDETLTIKGAPVVLNSSINVITFSIDTLDREIGKATEEVLGMFIIATVLIITFSVVSCLMFDQVRSKPFVAMMGFVSSGLAVLVTFGTLFYAGLPYAQTVGLVPFLVTAIGVDGMFLFVSAWRHTSPYLPLEERVALTYREAAVSVTIASLTDCLAIAMGLMSPFRAIVFFSAFAAMAILINLIFQLTFFGGCFALLVRREQANRHSLICKRITPPSSNGNKTGLHRICCVGGVNREIKNPKDNKQHILNVFFGQHYPVWISKLPVIICFSLLYLGYAGGAVYGILHIEEGLERKSLFLDDSPYKDVITKHRHVLYNHNYMTVVIDQPLDYSSSAQIQKVYHLHDKLMELRYFNKNSSIMWFDAFQRYLRSQNITATTYSQYIDVLTQGFLRNTFYEKYKTDIMFEYNDKDEAIGILYSRFYLSAMAGETTTDDKNFMLDAREVVDSSELECICSYGLWVYHEQYPLIVESTLQLLGFGTGAVLLICLMFLPMPLVALVVLFSIVSIEVGIVGYMALWGVRLDITATLCLMISTGFVVDFTAHLAYAYSQASGKRLNKAMSLTAFPVLQSAISTIVGVAILSTSSNGVSVTFFKTVTLTMLCGMLHGIMWLPIFLNLVSKFECLFPNENSSTLNKLGKEADLAGETEPKAIGNTYNIDNEAAKTGWRSSPLKNNRKWECSPSVPDVSIQTWEVSPVYAKFNLEDNPKWEHSPRKSISDVPKITSEISYADTNSNRKLKRSQRPRPESLDDYINTWNTDFKHYVPPSQTVLQRSVQTCASSNCDTTNPSKEDPYHNSSLPLSRTSTPSRQSIRTCTLNAVYNNAVFEDSDENPEIGDKRRIQTEEENVRVYP